MTARSLFDREWMAERMQADLDEALRDRDLFAYFDNND